MKYIMIFALMMLTVSQCVAGPKHVLKSVYDPTAKSQTVITNTLPASYVDLQICMGTDGETMTADNYHSGWRVSSGTNVLSEGQWPSSGVTLISTDQRVLHTVRIPWEPDWNVTVETWTENGGERKESVQVVKVPRPAKPYASWLWEADEKSWEAPIAYPKDGKRYEWDEKNVKWKLSSLEAIDRN